MRQVDSEGGIQGGRGRKRSAVRSLESQKSHLRRLALEGLEPRTLLSTLPSPTATIQVPIGGDLGGVFGSVPSQSGAGNQSSPTVAVDPLNPLKMAAAWVTYDPNNKIDVGNGGGQVVSYVQGAFSTDGGLTWNELPGDTDADIQTDFSQAAVTSGVQPNFTNTSDATIAIGRDENIYLLTSTHNGPNTSGVLDLQKWDFSTSTPAQKTFTTPSYDSLQNSFDGAGNTLNPIYRWQGYDGAITPTLAVDTNLPSFTQNGLTQTDPFAGNVYVAWETNDAAPTNVTQNPNLIKLMSSSNQGQDFTYQAYLNNHNTGNLYDSPKIAISQGTAVPTGTTPTVPGGQVTIVYDNAGPGAIVQPYFDQIQSKASTTGGTDEQVSSARNVTLVQPTPTGTSNNYIPGVTDVPFNVNITDANFLSLSNLSINLSLQVPTLSDTSAVLVSPTGQTITLWDTATDATGTATKSPFVLNGANMGAATITTPGDPIYIGTTLDSTANRSLFDTGATAPYAGHFRPENNLTSPFRGLSAAQIKGVWHLQITSYQPETSTTVPFIGLVGASLNFTSGNSDITGARVHTVATSFLNSGAVPFTDGIQTAAVLPNPSIASDNTLGSNSPYQGRLYVALTNDDFNAASNAYTTSTFIELYYSDDGGTTWNYDGVVNDDNGLTDGFSTGGYAVGGLLASQADQGVSFFGQIGANVRPKIEPQVAVDQYTGSVVVSYLDTRNDASAVRVATYVAASTDGGASFAPQTFANATSNAYQAPVQDAITGSTVVLGPIPDNQSGGNFNRESVFGFGQHQALAVADGRIIPVWSSNENTGSAQLNSKQYLSIESAQMTLAAGPRVIASTQGPVGQPGDSVNLGRRADGTPIANTIVLTFDRPVDPASFPADGANIGSSPIQVFYNNPSGTAAPVPLRVMSVTADASDTIFTVVFDPQNYGVGTYSYTLRPLVTGMIPYQSLISVIQQVPFIDTAQNSGTANFTVSGYTGINLTKASIQGNIDVYQPGTGTTGNVQIYLVANDGTQYLLDTVATASATANEVFTVNATIPIPTTPVAQPLAQNYKIKVVDSVAGQQVFLYNNANPADFNFQVQLDEGLTQVINGNPLDQNANGVPGEIPDDDYSIPNGRGTLPLIVPGPHVASTSVTGVNGVTGTGSNNLVNNDNVNAVTVTFDRTMQVSSFTPAQVLSVVGPAGPINTPQTFTSTGTSNTYSYNGVPLPIPKATGAGNGVLTSIIPISGAPANVSSLTVQVNITDPNDSSLQLSLMAPDGTLVPLVLAGSASGANFTNTTFSDTTPANGLNLTIPGAPASAAAPYGLIYTPASPLSTLAGKAINGNWSLVITDNTTGGGAGRLNSWSLSITPQVPQGTGGPLTSSLVIANYPDNSFTISHLAVQLNISAGRDADLQVSLIAPDGTTIIPLIPTGLAGSNFAGTILDDNATIPITAGASPYNLTYKPVGSLSSLIGRSIEGTWKLQITDAVTGGPVATLNSWSLIATPQITVNAVNPVNGGATSFVVGFPTQKLSGSYSVTLSPNILSVSPNPANPSMGTPLDTNLNAGVYNLEGITTGKTTSDFFPATSVPVTIPYATKPAIGAPINGVLTSQINVTDNFAIQGDVGTLAGLTVSLNISYYYDPDLTATLTAPNGKTITLFMNVGKGSSTANFTNTTLSDTVTPVSPITAAGAPFFGTFNPENSLASFVTDNNGDQAFSGGLWTLTINNQGFDPGSTTDAQYPPSLLGWSLNFQKPQSNTGLGEPIADQATVGFQLFNLAPTNPLANDTWTAVGPAGTKTVANPNDTTGDSTGVNLGGPVSVVAVDPSDPSGNTAYIGASSGGIWKTTNFLTNNPTGPNYIPLTDFGVNYSINIGSIAIFDQNGDPNQSIIFAGTGNAQATTANQGNSVQGVGFLRSINGGTSFTLLDSSENVYPSTYPATYPNGTAVPANLVGTAVPANLVGTNLPVNSPFRDHIFVGTTTYKVVVDPTPLPGGGVIVYAALGGNHGGLWRSDDGGNTWQNLSNATVGQNVAATDVLLDQASASPSTGNLDILYAAFQGVGVFISSNRGQSLTEMTGTVGADNLLQDSLTVPAQPLTVPITGSPNGANGRIILAKPALTGNASADTLYQDWLYAAVENANGTFNGLYVTKDRGENWTKAQIASIPDTGLVPTVAEPTNDNTQANNYDVTSSKSFPVQNGNAAFSMTIDPQNPNIIYLGGTTNYQTSGLIRVDLTGMFDAHNYVPFANNLNDGGKLALDTNGAVNAVSIANGIPYFQGVNPSGPPTGFNYLNLRHSPVAINAFDINSTQFVYNSSAFSNDGYGVTWTPIDSPYADPLDGSTNIHQLTTIIDPVTGLTRLLIADDQGVFTAVLNADGSLNLGGIGTQPVVSGSLNGNLQDEELYGTAAQPSALAAQTAGALFYGSGIGLTDAQSDPNLLSNGNLTWTVVGPGYGDLQNVIQSNDHTGTGIATDPTGGTTISNPTGTGPSVYEFDTPYLGGDTTNFFRVNNNGQTTGLTNNYQAQWPGTGVLSNGNGVTQLGNFTVNPLNGSQILIGSNTGNVYETTNKGIQWLQIGSASDFDGTYAAVTVYGAPDPSAPGGTGNLNNFIYVGTEGGHVYLTRNGGGPWTSLSAGLDGSSIVSIYTNPNRGSHELYAITLKGVYYMADSVASASNPNPTWVNITGNLNQIQTNPFGDVTQAQNALLGYNGATGQLGGLRSIVVDYRYAIPDPSGNGLVHPVLYVSGYGGVFRSLDNGQTWTSFPNTSFDSAPVNGGYLPNVDVTSLQLNLGAINPATGHAAQKAGDPEVLLASTLGRGDFAIRLAPDVFSSTITLDTTQPLPGGSDSGVIRGYPTYTNVLNPYIDGNSEISNYGNIVTINLYDQANGTLIGTGQTDAFGHFSIQIQAQKTDMNAPYYDPSFLMDGIKTIGIQATDSSMATGNITTFTYNLKATPPANPTALTLTNDSGRSSTDDVSKLIPPTFSVQSTEPNSTLVELVRLVLGSTTQYEVVGTAAAGTANGTVTLTDNQLATELAGATISQSLTYYAIQIDLANNYSTTLSNITSDPTKLSVFLDNVTPAAPTSLSLDPSTNSGTNKTANITNSTNPLFDVTGLLTTGPVSPYNLVLYRSFGGSTPIQVGTAAPGVTQVRDTMGIPTNAGGTINGVYVYSVAQVDLAGNVSSQSAGLPITINTQAPATPTLQLYPADDSGAPSHPNVTNVTSPRFNGIGTANLPIVLYNQATGQGLATATVTSNGTYLLQIIGPVADGTYTLVAKITNAAGNSASSAPLTVTIKNAAPAAPQNLQLQPASDTGILGDGVTSNHHPVFIGTAEPSSLVTLYALLPNGQLSAPQGTTTASATNGAFTFQLPYSLTDGTTTLVAKATDIASNNSTISSPLNVRIVSIAGDYYATGTARLAVFNPANESYTVQNAGTVQVDTTPGRDVPVQYDFNGDGSTDLVAYRFNAAQYYGSTIGSVTPVNTYFGQPGVALPVSGYYGGYGTFINADYNPNTATWSIALPQAGGYVTQFGVGKFNGVNVDIPVPAAYDGNGITEIATFRPSFVSNATDPDSFNVDSASGYYQVSFTSPAVQKLGFVYKAGDIPAPADYDGVGSDEFAIYRPTTGQFFILKTPNPRDSSTWTLRTVQLNLPGGPNANDVPASEDYTGDGKADPTVYRTSNSTFYSINSATGIQQNVSFGTPGLIAASGPLLYRLTALQGAYATTGGYGPTGQTVTTGAILPVGSTVHIESVASAGSTSTSTAAATTSGSSANLANLVVVSTPIPTTPTTPTPGSNVSNLVSIPTTSPATSGGAVTVGASIPRSVASAPAHKAKATHLSKSEKPVAEKAKAPVKPLSTATRVHQTPVQTVVEHPKTPASTASASAAESSHRRTYAAVAVAALQKLVLARKGSKKA